MGGQALLLGTFVSGSRIATLVQGTRHCSFLFCVGTVLYFCLVCSTKCCNSSSKMLGSLSQSIAQGTAISLSILFMKEYQEKVILGIFYAPHICTEHVTYAFVSSTDFPAIVG